MATTPVCSLCTPLPPEAGSPGRRGSVWWDAGMEPVDAHDSHTHLLAVFCCALMRGGLRLLPNPSSPMASKARILLLKQPSWDCRFRISLWIRQGACLLPVISHTVISGHITESKHDNQQGVIPFCFK